MFWLKKKSSKQAINKVDGPKTYGFRVNQHIRLILTLDGTQTKLLSVVQDVLEDRVRIISLDKKYRQLISDSKTKIEVEVFEEDGIYKFESRFLGEFFEQIEMYELSKPLKIHRLQRRGYKRCKVDWQVEYSFMPAFLGKYPFLKKEGFFQMQDISASGVRIVAYQELPVGIACRLNFVLDTKHRKKVQLMAKVLDCKQDILRHQYIVRMIFTDLVEDVRIMIDDYVRNS